MKKVLSLLVAFVFMQVQTWALSGGPRYGGNQAAVSGTYAGVFTGITGAAIAPTGGTLIDPTGSNALGLFIIGVPQTDIADGTMAIFFEGSFFQGGILAIADPNKQTLTGVCQAVHVTQLSSSFSLFTGASSISLNYDARADGTIKTKIGVASAATGATLKGTGTFNITNILSNLVQFPNPNFVDPITTPGVPPFITLLEQTNFPAGSLSFIVDGFKQSQTVVTTKSDSIANLLNGQGNAPTGG